MAPSLRRPSAEPVALAGEAWPRPYGDPARSQLRWRARHGPAPTATQRGASCAGGRGMAPPLRRPSAEPVALAGEAWPRPYGDPARSQLRWRARHGPAPTATQRGASCAGGRGMAPPLRRPSAEPVALAGEAWPRPYGDPTRSQLRRGEAMPRPPASNRGCPEPVSQVMNQHTHFNIGAELIHCLISLPPNSGS